MNCEKKPSEKASILSGVGWSYAERIMAQAITLLISIVLARLLSPDHYGVISIVTVFITIGDALVVGGFGNALVQKKETEEIDFNSICWVSITVSLAVYCILFLSAPLVSTFYSMPQLTPIIRVMGIKFIFSAFNSVQHAYVQKNMMFRMSDYLKKDCVTKKLVKTRSQSLVGGSKNHSHSYSLFTSQYTRWKSQTLLCSWRGG